MYIIYHCYGGAHSSVTAAAIHLGLISEHDIPTPEEILALPYYDQATQDDHGYLRHLGDDSEGNSIFIIGRRGLRDCFSALIRSLANLLEVPTEEILIVDTVPCVNWMMMVGGFTSRRWEWVKFGRPLVVKGTQKAFPNFVELVRKTKAQIQGGKLSEKHHLFL